MENGWTEAIKEKDKQIAELTNSGFRICRADGDPDGKGMPTSIVIEKLNSDDAGVYVKDEQIATMTLRKYQFRDLQHGTWREAYLVSEVDEHIAALTERVRELESAMNLFGEDPSWCELLVEKCAEITKQDEQIAALHRDLENMIGEKISYQEGYEEQGEQMAALERDNKVMAAILKERDDLVSGLGVMTCRNGEKHDLNKEEDCFYCAMDMLTGENKWLKKALGEIASIPDCGCGVPCDCHPWWGIVCMAKAASGKAVK